MDHTVYRFDPLAMTAAADGRPVAGVGGGGASTVREPRIGVIYNPRSHRNKGQDLDCTERPDITVAQPDRREDIASALADFAQQGIDYLIINGGDGTVRDVLTMGQAVFGETWPALAILPKGKTNALNVDLGAPAGWNLSDAIAAYASGRRIVRRPLSVKREGAGDTPMLGFIFGCGAFTLGVEVGQDAHDLGFFNSLAVGATGAWGVLQALFGSNSNRWRRGTPTKLTYLPSGEPMPRSEHGDPGRRTLVLASTLEKMPLDIKLFAPAGEGIRLAVLDTARRRIMGIVPAILLGWRPEWLAKGGFHQLSAQSFAIEVGEPVILDGESFPAGTYVVGQGPELTFIAP
jgi:hypothetical protein